MFIFWVVDHVKVLRSCNMFCWSHITNCFKIVQNKESPPPTLIWNCYSEIHVGYPECSIHKGQSLGSVCLREPFPVAQMTIVLINTVCFRTKEKSLLGILLWKRMATECFLCTWKDGMYFKEMFPLKFLSICCTKIYCCIPFRQAPLGLWKCQFVHKNHFACPIHSTYKNRPEQNRFYIAGFMQRCAKSSFEFEGLKNEREKEA